MSFTAIAQRPASVPLWPRLLGDAVIAAAALAVTLALLRHGGIVATDSWSGRLDPVAVTLAVCSTLPLMAWRRDALTVFAATTSGPDGAYAVPNQVVERALGEIAAEVDTGSCTS